jgi:hypothetical protein
LGGHHRLQTRHVVGEHGQELSRRLNGRGLAVRRLRRCERAGDAARPPLGETVHPRRHPSEVLGRVAGGLQASIRQPGEVVQALGLQVPAVEVLEVALQTLDVA